MAKKNIDPSTFVFRDTTVEKFLKNMDAKNKPGKKRKKIALIQSGSCEEG